MVATSGFKEAEVGQGGLNIGAASHAISPETRDSVNDQEIIEDGQDLRHGQEDTTNTASRDGPQRYLRTLPLVMIVFYNVAGGPFGVEESVRSAGFFFAIVGFTVAPIVWSIPEAMITAELGSAYPEAAGGVAWVEEAFGPVAGWMAGFLGWISGATDNAIYPVLFLDYVLDLWSSSSDAVHPLFRFILISSTSILLGLLNWMGLAIVGNVSIVIGLLSLSPFISMALIGVFKLEPARWLQLPPENGDSDNDNGSASTFNASSIWTAMVSGSILWRPFLNNLFWNYNSYDSTASFAAEVEDPGRTLPRAMMGAMALSVAGYLVPILIATGATDSTQEDWVDGYLATAAKDIGGEWLGLWVVFAAGIANIALFQAELSADAFQLMGMAERRYIPPVFATRSRYGTPTYGIMLGVTVIVAMGSFDLDKLIEMLNFNYAIVLVLEYAAFIRLRTTKPHLDRPFRLALGTTRSIVYLVAPITATLLVMSLASSTTMLFGLAINAAGLVLYYCRPRETRSWSAYRCCCTAQKASTVEYEVIDLDLGSNNDLPTVT